MFSRMPWQTGLFPAGRAYWPQGVFFYTNVPNYPAYQTLPTRIDSLSRIDVASCIDGANVNTLPICIDSVTCIDCPVVNTFPNVNTYAMCIDYPTRIDGLSRIDSVTCIDGAMCIYSAIVTNYLIPQIGICIDSKRRAINHRV